jgi:glycosylphosphatidylinositol transamidase
VLKLQSQFLASAAHFLALANVFIPVLIARLLVRLLKPTTQQFLLIKSFSLLLLGLFLSALATLNFSLSLFLGLLCSPLSFVGYVEQSTPSAPPSDTSAPGEKPKDPIRSVKAVFGLVVLNYLAPTTVLLAACKMRDVSVEKVLVEAAFGWDVWGLWTQVAVWCIWWPAWLTGCILLSSSLNV